MSFPTPDHFNVGNTFGALFIGLIIGAVLSGMSNTQVFLYFHTHKKAGLTLYALAVVWLWVLDTLHLAATVHCVYHYLVTESSNFSKLRYVVWSFKLHLLFDVIIVSSVHVLYLHRVWKASRGQSRAVPIAVGLVIAIGLVFNIVLLWSTYHVHVFTDFIRLHFISYMSLSVVTLVDVLVASSLCYLLATSRTGFSSIDSIMSRLMVFVVHTGTLTSLCSLTVLITFAAMPENFIYFSIQFVFPKLYVNSFLALLNAQSYMHGVGPYSVSTGCIPLGEQRRTSKHRPIQSTWVNSLCSLNDDDALCPARPAETLTHAHRGIAVEVQMVTLSQSG